MDEIDDAIRKVGREVRAVILASVLAQPASDVHPGPALAERELDVGVGLIVAQQDVETWLALLDQVVFERKRFLVVGDDDVLDVDGFANERAGLSVFPAAFVEIAGHAAAEILRLAHIDHVAFGILVEVHAGFGGNGPNFRQQVHCAKDSLILLDGTISGRSQPHRHRVFRVSRNSNPPITLRLGMMTPGISW